MTRKFQDASSNDKKKIQNASSNNKKNFKTLHQMTKKNSRRFARSAFGLPRSALDECLPISIGDSNSVHFPTRAQNRLREETRITTRRRKTQSGGGTGSSLSSAL